MTATITHEDLEFWITALLGAKAWEVFPHVDPYDFKRAVQKLKISCSSLFSEVDAIPLAGLSEAVADYLRIDTMKDITDLPDGITYSATFDGDRHQIVELELDASGCQYIAKLRNKRTGVTKLLILDKDGTCPNEVTYGLEDLYPF